MPSTQPLAESFVESLIQKGVAQAIRDRCQCDFHEIFISQAVLLCDQQQPAQIVYRANITSYGNYSTDQLVSYIEDWVRQGDTITSGVVVVTLDPDCPVRINDISDPVCARPSTSSTSSVAPTSLVTPNSKLHASTILFIVAASVSVVAVALAVINIFNMILLNRKEKL